MEDNFIKSVNDGDVIMVRILLKGEILIDPRMVRFREMQRFAESKIADLYEVHDGTSLDIPESNWSESLHVQIQKDLNRNFSKERLDFYARIAPVVLRDKINELQSSNPIQLDEPSNAIVTRSCRTIDAVKPQIKPNVFESKIELDDSFKQAVNDGDVIMVRILLKGEILIDPRIVRFREMQRFAESKIADLYEVHDGTSLDIPESNWSESLHVQIQKDLNRNFSKERLDFYARIAPVVLRDKVNELQSSNPIQLDEPSNSIVTRSCRTIDAVKPLIKPNVFESKIELDNSFKQAVNDGDVIMVRILLKGEILIDPRMVRFREMQRFAESKIADLYEEHDGENLDIPESDWTESLHAQIQKDLNRNFSKERLDLYAEMAIIVLRDKIADLQESNPINWKTTIDSPIEVLEAPTEEASIEEAPTEEASTEKTPTDTSHRSNCFGTGDGHKSESQKTNSDAVKAVVAVLIISLGIAILLS